MSTYCYLGLLVCAHFLKPYLEPTLKRIDKQVQQAAMWFYPIVGAILGVLFSQLGAAVRPV